MGEAQRIDELEQQPDTAAEHRAALPPQLPWEEVPMGAAECAALWKVSAGHFLDRIACRPGFPQRLQRKPAIWRAGEVVAYRNRHRA